MIWKLGAAVLAFTVFAAQSLAPAESLRLPLRELSNTEMQQMARTELFGADPVKTSTAFASAALPTAVLLWVIRNAVSLTAFLVLLKTTTTLCP